MTEAWQQQGKLLETILRHFQTKQIFRRNNYYVSAKKAGQSVDSRSVPRGKTHATSGEIMDAENNFQTGTGWYFFFWFFKEEEEVIIIQQLIYIFFHCCLSSLIVVSTSASFPSLHFYYDCVTAKPHFLPFLFWLPCFVRLGSHVY